MCRAVCAHELIASFPIDLAQRLACGVGQGRLGGQEMQHIFAYFTGAQDRENRPAKHQSAGVTRLSTSAGIKGAAVQDHRVVFLAHCDHVGVEGL